MYAAGALSVDAPIRALVPGAAGNVSAGTIVSMAVAPMGISACSNPLPCAGGADGEGDAALRERVLESFKRLPNGANAAFYQQGALSFDQVAAAAVVPRPRGVGSVDVVPATRRSRRYWAWLMASPPPSKRPAGAACRWTPGGRRPGRSGHRV